MVPEVGENAGVDAPVSKGETEGERVTKGVMAGVKFGENAGEVYRVEGGLMGERGSEDTEESMSVVTSPVGGFRESRLEGKLKLTVFFGCASSFILPISRKTSANGWNCGPQSRR